MDFFPRGFLCCVLFCVPYETYSHSQKPRHGVAAAMMAVVASSVFSTKKVKALSVSIIYFQLFERRRVFSIFLLFSLG